MYVLTIKFRFFGLTTCYLRSLAIQVFLNKYRYMKILNQVWLCLTTSDFETQVMLSICLDYYYKGSTAM